MIARMESFNGDTEYIISRAKLNHLLDVEWKNKNSKLKYRSESYPSDIYRVFGGNAHLGSHSREHGPKNTAK